MLDVQGRRRGVVVVVVLEGGKRRKEEGTNRYGGEKTQKWKNLTGLSSFLLFLSLFGVGNGLTLNDVCQAE